MFFEQHVAAYWLAQLLVRGIPPILIETIVTEVHFQTEHLGWHTDDFLIVCEGPAAVLQKLVGQVKRSFTVSAGDEECKKAIRDFWQDFNNPASFTPAQDRLVLVTLRGTNTLLQHFVGLLDCARAARDGGEFEHRLATKGFISNKAVQYCGELCKIIGAFEGTAIAAADLWPFLRRLHVLSLDLNSSTRQTEALIKYLLAHTTTDGNAAGLASASWNALLALASTAMSEAISLRRADLPEELQHRHGSVGAKEQHILRALKDHTAPVIRRIRSTIGQDFHLQRAALVQQVLCELETAQVVLVSGPAGSGKSAIGKDVVSHLSQECFIFGFRVEEFAQAHIDATLHVAQIPTNAEVLAAILATQGRKVVLIESVERLLEKSTRDAFSDLMTMAAADRGMCIILTCRDYSTEQVRTSFLQPVGINHAVVSVPPLEDAELAEIEMALPQLVYPLKNPALRDILRNPYLLDKALEIPWSAERPVPVSEREFRTLFWRQVVRSDQGGATGMARRREEVFQKIAVRRARALSAFVVCNDLDPAVVASLRQDSLIVQSDENPSLLATSHDVLEDWAILQWLDEQHLTDKGAFQALSVAVGAHPAIRRSYRKWVAELVEREPPAADRLFLAAITETEITAQFRDDTLISLLKAPSAPEFLVRHEPQLLANNLIIFKRVIHLLRVACVASPTWLPPGTGHGSVFNVPDGPAWVTVLMLVHRNIRSFTQKERPLLLGLIEDSVRNVSWWSPEMDGAEFAAGIGHWLLAGFDGYRSAEARKRVLKVLAKIPKADAARFEALLRGVVELGQRRDWTAEDLRQIVFTGPDGMPAARDLPDVFVSVAADHFLATDEGVRDRSFRGSLMLETHFGIKDGLRHDFFPASALRGPWLPFLRHHARQGLDFLIKVFNHSADWYIHPRVHDPLEPAWEIELTFADGTTKKHFGNPRFWNLYRGTSVGPYVLQSLLMALETWLLEYAGKYPEQLDAALVYILSESDSAALAAVVASVATAYPHVSEEAILVLLSASDYIMFDRARMAGEQQASALLGIFPQFNADNKLHVEDRKVANALPHRSKDLETAVANLQLGPLATRVHAILDRHIAALPPKSEQDKSDLIWQLAIHRMDFRQYTVSETSEEEALADATTEGESPRYLKLEPKAPEPEVQAMVEESAAQHAAMGARLGVLMWGIESFERKSGNFDPSRWHENLEKSRIMDLECELPDGSRNGPGVVAAVCVRDHWDDMSAEQRDWCVDIVCFEILRHANRWNQMERTQRFSMAADRPSAAVVPLLLGKPLTEQQMLNVRRAFVAALTYPNDEVRWYATWAIDRSFWDIHRALALRCANAIATEAALISKAWEVEEKKSYEQRRNFDQVTAEAASTVRQRFWEDGAIAEDAHRTVDMSEGFGAEAIGRMLAILGQVPEDPMAVDAFARASRTLVQWRNTDDGERRNDRNFEAESTLATILQQFVMRATPAAALEVLQPVLDAVDSHPREIYSIVEGLTVIEDSNPNTAQYWYLWGLFANRVERASWVAWLDREHPVGREMLSAIFLTSWWKENVRHWRSLEGYADKVHALFEALPASWIVLDDYLRFLYHIGERSLPGAFIRVAKSIKSGNAQAMLAKDNTVFLLEVLLQRHVYGRPLELKREPDLRGAILLLLDILVENGSSAGFRMRDDFVTPAS
ncbi:nSTAND1 domain-containing NTPase [Geomonas ferrireducens]|uniref:nSTAND1 domain-containing NTPase n=1 Tax=Geomonas ferrireducens TaxID=2570227 RepID=UPI0010A7D4B1|nr:AAA family ATPase [Geomonas ferrireducens]